MTALYGKALAGALTAAVLAVTVKKQEGDLSLVLSMCACILAALGAFSLLEPVLTFLRELEELAQLQSGVLGILLKITGIALTGELAAAILSDSGNAALARGMQMFTGAVITVLSLPILETLIRLVQEILGGI